MAEQKKPNSKAVALKYETGDEAPRVVGKGRGYVADKLLEQAKLNSIPVYRDAKLVEELTGISLGDNIPPELYEIVAQVLVFVTDLDKRGKYLLKK
ncbi:MAG: EscU/YscU/HrcU family type III secretion system export apparatus switch protein [Clostridiales bacterium]|jgi:flagellar biosynthesis protein|nr:EscU/YscU/HrcU family type III secretion system export apparatus switch protein [Clostridiales bacterium]